MLMVAATLTVLHLVVLRLAFGDGSTLDPRYEGYQLLNLDEEVSLPTWWQQSALLAAAVISLLLAQEARRAAREQHRHWSVLAAVLLFVSIDEGTQIHERFTAPVRDGLGVEGGLLYYAWIVPVVVLLLLFVVSYYRFWTRLPARPRLLLALAGITYVAGGIGVESLGGAYDADRGQDYGFVVLTAIEEALEMIGQSLLIWALLLLLADRTADRWLTLGPEAERSGSGVR